MGKYGPEKPPYLGTFHTVINMKNTEIMFLIYKWRLNFLDLKGKNGSDDRKVTEKHYFHCDSQVEKAIKSF